MGVGGVRFVNVGLYSVGFGAYPVGFGAYPVGFGGVEKCQCKCLKISMGVLNNFNGGVEHFSMEVLKNLMGY